jgi:hypothetical protein
MQGESVRFLDSKRLEWPVQRGVLAARLEPVLSRPVVPPRLLARTLGAKGKRIVDLYD